jgi:hypothetical protein
MTTFQDLSDNDKEVVSTLHHLILANWVEAAGLAWVSFRAHGRGAIILDFRPYHSPPDSLPYAGFARRQDVAPDDAGLAHLRALLDSYSPEEEIVFVIYTPLGDTVFELIPAFGGRPGPANAAAPDHPPD